MVNLAKNAGLDKGIYLKFEKKYTYIKKITGLEQQ